MLYIVLLLVLAALGLLVAALVTANSLWAWISIGLSVAAGVALLIDWLRGRSRPKRGDDSPGDADADQAVADGDEPGQRGEGDESARESAEDESAGGARPASDTALLPASGELSDGPAAGATTGDGPGEAEDDGPTGGTAAAGDEPAEEATDAADLLIVSELPDQVLVVDEYPRYHLGGCTWLDHRATITIAVSEARELGFTPCARCGPDSELAIQYRAKRR